MILSWLRINGIEVSNAARTVDYLTNQPVPGWEVKSACPCWVLRLDDDDDPVTFVSPSVDGAPWYSAADPASGEFFGMLITEAPNLDSTASREVEDRASGLGGGVLGSEIHKPRSLNFKGVLVASSKRGIEYGKRWLAWALAADWCEPDEQAVLEVRSHCPPVGGDPDEGYWIMHDVGVTSGPKTTAEAADGKWAEVEFTVACGIPFLYRCEQQVIAATEFPLYVGTCVPFEQWMCGPGSTVACSIPHETPYAITSPVVSVYGGSEGLCGVTLELACAVPADTVAAKMRLSCVPEASTIRVDSSLHRIEITTDGVIWADATEYVDLYDVDGSVLGLQWLEGAACADMVLKVTTDNWCFPDDATVAVDSRVRSR